MARLNIGGRPADVKKDGENIVVAFHPMTPQARNPDAVMFRITLSKDDVEALKSAF